MDTEVRDATDQQRYEAYVDGELAGFAEYVRREGTIVLTHTEVDDAYEGRGVGGDLARGALDGARAGGLAVIPRCPFIAGWIDRHDDYKDLVLR